MCCMFSAFAQKDISQRLNNDLMSSGNEKECKMQQITESDIMNISDSTHFNYYYLRASWAYEKEEFEKEIEWLVKAKELCETKLGIFNNVAVYFEIIRGLGEACEALNMDDEALLWYEEGIIKSLAIEALNVEPFRSYLNDIYDNAADIYEKKGHSDMAKFLRNCIVRPLGYFDSMEYASELLHLALQLNAERKCAEAISKLDEAKRILKKHGKKGKEMMQPLYREYLRCYAMVGDTNRIDALLKSKRNLIFYSDTTSYLVKDMSEVIATFISVHYDMKTALKYYQVLVNEVGSKNDDEIQSVNQLGQTIQFYEGCYSQMDSLENVRRTVPEFSYEWCVTSQRLANILFEVKREDDGAEICKQIYEISKTFVDDPCDLHWYVTESIASYYLYTENWSNAEHYLKEILLWLDNKVVPEVHEWRYNIYNALGIVYMKRQRFNESRTMLDKAEQIVLSLYGDQSSEYATMLHNKGRLAQLKGELDEAKKYLEESAIIQHVIEGKVRDKTEQYINEVYHDITSVS